MQDNGFNYQKAVCTMAVLPLAFLMSCQPADALTTQEIRELNYEQVKGTGIANRCPEVQPTKVGKEQRIPLEKGLKYKIVDMCLEPKSFQIEVDIQKRKGEVSKGKTILGKSLTPEIGILRCFFFMILCLSSGLDITDSYVIL
jgi:photosystem II oxygen-evolving enhancer protein 1